MRTGDLVDVYIPIGEEPYIHEERTIVSIEGNGTVHLDDNSSVHISFCTLIKNKPNPLLKQPIGGRG